MKNADIAIEFYTPIEVKNKLKCSRGYIYTLIKKKGFPKPIHLSTRCRRWNADEVDQWCKAQCNAK